MKLPSVSLVIPTLNEARNIAPLLDCLAQLGLPLREVLVVDGGSQDGTAVIAAAHPGVKVLTSSPPVGRQRQAGLEAVQGDYCVFLDADTRPEPHFLAASLGQMQQRRLQIACPCYWPLDSTGAIRAVYAAFNRLFVGVQRLLPSGAGTCIVVETACARKAGGFKADLVFDDIEFIRRTARQGRFGMISTTLAVSDRRFRKYGTLRMLGQYSLLSLFFTLGAFRGAERVRYPFADYEEEDEERVVLVDDHNQPLGTAPKRWVHSAHTPLHRGFSVFLFNSAGKLLLQQRSFRKQTWPGEWSNTCCGHPFLGESVEEAVRRRLDYELGLQQVNLQIALPNYRYRVEKDGVVENELCPVLVGFTNQCPQPYPEEVEAVEWVDWEPFLAAIRDGTRALSPWCQEEALLLQEKFTASGPSGKGPGLPLRGPGGPSNPRCPGETRGLPASD